MLPCGPEGNVGVFPSMPFGSLLSLTGKNKGFEHLSLFFGGDRLCVCVYLSVLKVLMGQNSD